MDTQIDHFFSSINNSITKLSKKLEKQKQELTEAQKHLWYKQIADSLLASESITTRGYSQIKITNLHTNKEETVPVNPKFGAPANAKLYYKKAKKGARGEEINLKKVAATEDELNKLNAFLDKITKLSQSDFENANLEELTAELQLLTNEKVSSPSTKNGHTNTTIPPFRHFYTDGWDIYVGKSDEQNDELTVHFATPSDIWLHVAAHPGSHVLIRKPKNKPVVPENILRIAAEMAVWFSKAKHTSFAEVHYTEARFVRKRRHAPAGQVIVERCKSLRVAPKSPQEIFKQPFMDD